MKWPVPKDLVPYWRSNPLLQVLLCVFLGAAAFDWLQPGPFLVYALAALALLNGFLWLHAGLAARLGPSVGRIRMLSVWLLSFFFSWTIRQIQQAPPLSDPGLAFAGRILETYSCSASGRLQVLVQLQQVKQSDKSWHPISEKVLLSFSDCGMQVQAGARVVVGKPLATIEKPTIPGQFDAQKFYERKGIRYQVFCQPFDVHLQPGEADFSLPVFARSVRDRLMQQIYDHTRTPGDAALLSALLLGSKRQIDPELKAAFSASGVSHILAVSGMHVGLVFTFLAFCLSWIKKWSRGKTVYAGLIVVFLWLYALVTGLSPSVLRAVTVFSVLQLGELSDRKGLGINALCFASVFLFAFDPDLLYDVGFQLSFAAVFGILSLQKPILSFWHTRQRVLHYIWENISLTLAATLATAPLILLYFHQFPVYFLLANILAVPLATCLIYSGITLLVLSFCSSSLAGLLAWLVYRLSWFFQGFVLAISRLPYSVLEDIHLPLFGLILFYVALCFFQVFLVSARMGLLNWSLGILVLLFLSLGFEQFWMGSRPDTLFAIRTRKEWMLGQKRGFSARLNLLGSDTSKGRYAFEAKALREGFHIKHVALSSISGHPVFRKTRSDREVFSRLLEAEGKKLLVLDHHPGIKKVWNEKIPIDILIVRHAGLKALENALLAFKPKAIWVDWSAATEERWKAWKHPVEVLNFRHVRYREGIALAISD